MALSRSFLNLLVTAAISVGAQAQEQPAPPVQPTPPAPGQSGEPREPRRNTPERPRPDGERPRPDGEHRERPWGNWGEKRPPREELTPDQVKERALKELEKLTPEQRNEVWRSVWAVLNLTPEQRQQLIGTEENRRKRIRAEIDQMMKDAGVQGNDEQRRRFFRRIISARREIEEKLKKESEERRQVLMTEMEARVKEEFSKKPDAPQPPPQPPTPPAQDTPNAK